MSLPTQPGPVPALEAYALCGALLLPLIAARDRTVLALAVRATAFAGFAIGVPLNVVYAASFDSGSWTETVSGTFGILPLSAGYAAVCCLIWLGGRGRERLRRLAPVGRMALTNYVGQSVICMLIFRGTGLGLGGTMGPTLYLPIGFAVYAVQVAASRRWLERFRFGPLEWLWRMLTYGEWLPLSRRPAANIVG